MLQRLTITTPDEVDLDAFLYEPQDVIKGSILLNTGLGIPKNILENYYEKITQSIDVIRFEDDPIAIPKTVNAMMDYYKNAPIEIHSFDPEKLGK